MIDFQKLKGICESNSAVSRRLVDDFMMYYAADRGNLEKEMLLQFNHFRHITEQFPESVVNQMMAQYIIHRVFRRDGLIGKYINHAEVKRQGADALKYFKRQEENPWRFAFTEMIDMPTPDFHLHRNVFSGEEYLIYSPGMSQTFSDYNEMVRLWFNLLTFNGHCWQTYGPIAAYKGIEPDDVFYFAGEIDDSVFEDDDVCELIEKNPVPFMMLVSGGNVPIIVNNNDQLIVHTAVIDAPGLDPEGLRPKFSVERNHDIWKLSLPKWSEPMHYATAYFDSTDDGLFCYSMTERGFEALTAALAEEGLEIEGADIRVNMSSLITMEEILGRKIRTNPYEAAFEKPVAEGDNEQLKKLNAALKLAMNDFNAGKTPDYEAYAAASGLTVDELKPIIEKSLARIRTLLDKK